jgi:hypothetical protein
MNIFVISIAVGLLILVVYIIISMSSAQYFARKRITTKKKEIKAISPKRQAILQYFNFDGKTPYEIDNWEQIYITSNRRPPLPMQIIPTGIDDQDHVLGTLRILCPYGYHTKILYFEQDTILSHFNRESFCIKFKFRSPKGRWNEQGWLGIKGRPKVDKFPICITDYVFVATAAGNIPPVPIV